MANLQVRDTVFCRFIGTESHLLEIFNAIRHTHYTDTSKVLITTLAGSFYSNIKNDISFIDEAVRDTVRYCIDNDVMKNYLLHNESEVIDMFGFEWNEKEEREALLEAGEARGRLNSIRDLLSDGLVTLDALKASGRYSPEELAAIAKP